MATKKKETKKEPVDLVEIMLNNPLINLDLSGILYVSAHDHCVKDETNYKKPKNTIDEHNSNKRKKGNMKWYSEIMWRKMRELERVYEPVVREFATTKILLVNCAEAFINEVAACDLTNRQFAEFDKLSLTGKWLFLPMLLKLKKNPFTLDKDPMQSFAMLVTERNKLVHFKGSRVRLADHNLPNFIEDYKLTPKSCQQALKVVKTMIQKLEEIWVGSYGPDWLDVGQPTFRRPGFFMGARNCASYTCSSKVDSKRMKALFG